MSNIFQSPPNQDFLGEQSPDEMGEEENLIKIKLFFYCDSKAVREKLFPEEWYTVVAAEYGADQVSPDFQPWIEVSIRGRVTKLVCSVPCVRLRDFRRDAAQWPHRSKQTFRGDGV